MSELLTYDLERIIAGRMLIQANSGGGKSRALRWILEDTHGKVQQIVLDAEGEFGSLREKFDYILVGKGADVPTDPKTAKVLCRRLLELGASAVIDLYDLSLDNRRLFVKLFLEQLMHFPRVLWRPLLVVIDECHVFCPQVGGAESSDAVIALATQGRKRGYALLAATQRISKLHKDCAAELLNKMIGRTGLDVDISRAGEELGFSKEDRQGLKWLQPGDFYAYGPALSQEVKLVTTGEIQTTHPTPGQIAPPPPPAPESINALLGELKDISEESRKEVSDLAEAKAEIKRLQGELRKSPKPVDDGAIDAAVQAATAPLIQKIDGLVTIIAEAASVADDFSKAASTLAEEATKLKTVLVDHTTIARLTARRVAPKIVQQIDRQSEAQVLDDRPQKQPDSPIVLKEKQQQIIDAIAWWQSIGVTPTGNQVGAVALIDASGGYFSNLVGPLATNGLVERGKGTLSLTQLGQSLASQLTATPTMDGYHDMLREKVRGLKSANGKTIAILDVVITRDGESITTEEIGQLIQVDHTGGYFSNSIGPLSTLKLITRERGVVKPTSLLFPEGLK